MNMNDRRLYRTCASDFQALQRAAAPGEGIPLTVDGVCALLERQRGIAIQRYPASLRGHPYGLVVRGKDLCIILYERHTSAWHQQGIILHECGHIFYDHQGTEDGTAAALRMLVPDLPDEDLHAVRHRAGGEEGHSPEDERQAEMFATVGLAWLSRAHTRPCGSSVAPAAPPPPDDPAVAAVVRRLMADFAGGEKP